MPLSNLEVGVKREKRFTHATLVDATGTVIGAALCDLRYLPDGGLQRFDQFEIDVEKDSDGDCTLLIDQDPPTDWHIVYRMGGFRVGDTVTIRSSANHTVSVMNDAGTSKVS